MEIDLSTLPSLLTAFGFGGLIVGWAGAAKARREMRAGVLTAVDTVETTRWSGTTYLDFRNACRALEAAALIARIPREAVRHYLVFAEAGRHLSDDSDEERGGDEELGAGGIDGYFAELIKDSAELLARLAWHPWWHRLRKSADLKRLRARALTFDDGAIKWRLATGQQAHGALPGKLGEMPNLSLPPQFVKPSRKWRLVRRCRLNRSKP